MTAQAAWLLVALFTVHFVGDFTPATLRPMREAKAAGGPAVLILAHAATHGALVGLAVAAIAGPELTVVAGAAGVEIVSHFLIDFGRARWMAAGQGPSDPEERGFWTLLGADQLAHALVLIGVAAWVL